MRYHRTPTGSITRCTEPEACAHSDPVAWTSAEAQASLPDPENRMPIEWSLDRLTLTDLLLTFRRLRAVADAFTQLGAEGAVAALERGLERAREEFPHAGWASTGEEEVRGYVRALVAPDNTATTTYFRHLIYLLGRGRGQDAPNPRALWNGVIELVDE